MDYLETLSNFILFFSLLLLAVIIVSYLFYKYLKPVEEFGDKKIGEERERIRQYIRNQRNYLTTSSTKKSTQLNYRIYNAPTYSDKETKNLTRTRYFKTNSIDLPEQRYKIVNDTWNIESRSEKIDDIRRNYSPQNEQHLYNKY